MSSHILGVLRSTRHRRRALTRHGRELGRNEEGATIVEFAIVVVPFLALLFAIIEIALVFFAGQVLETAVADSARRIMTGEVQNTKPAMNAAGFKADICGRLHALFTCGDIKVDVRTFGNFGDAALKALTPPKFKPDGELEAGESFDEFVTGSQGSIVVVRAIYQWPTITQQFGLDLATLSNGKRLLMATAAFRNEPYKSN